MNKLRIQVWIEIAICAGIALFLDVVVPTPSFAFVISIKMLPIIILSLRRGLLAGVIGGFIWGLLQFVIGDAFILSVLQFIIEYFVAFALVGLAGIFSNRMQNLLRDQPSNYRIQALIASLALIIGSFARYVIHFIAGVWFWSAYAPEGQGAGLYSLLVNGGAFLSETLTTLVAIILLTRFFGQLIKVNESVTY